jgi:two-component flavin-dependent monooxygenase
MSRTEPTVTVGAAAIVDLVAAHAASADADGRLADEVVRAVLAAGFARHFVPAKWGGREGTFEEVTRAAATLGEHCPSTAWIASLAATLSRIAGYLPVEGQRQVWEGKPDALVVGSLLPLGQATVVDNGWLVRGAWPYISSVEFSDWALVLARTTTPEPGEVRFYAVPRNAYRIESTWSNVGMRATGSHTLVLDEVLVTPECSFARRDLDLGAPVDSTVAYHALPLEAVAGLAFAPPLLGAAKGALRTWTPLARHRLDALGAQGGPPAMQAAYHTTLARSAGEIDAAELLIARVARVADAGGPTALDTATCARDCALASDLLVAATDRLLHTAGTAALSQQHALQRFWRDVHSGASHIMLQSARAAAGYSRAVLADPSRST